jgi:hypothetical protein
MVKLAARGRRGRSRLDELEVVAYPHERPAVRRQDDDVERAEDRADGAALDSGPKASTPCAAFWSFRTAP